MGFARPTTYPIFPWTRANTSQSLSAAHKSCPRPIGWPAEIPFVARDCVKMFKWLAWIVSCMLASVHIGRQEYLGMYLPFLTPCFRIQFLSIYSVVLTACGRQFLTVSYFYFVFHIFLGMMSNLLLEIDKGRRSDPSIGSESLITHQQFPSQLTMIYFPSSWVSDSSTKELLKKFWLIILTPEEMVEPGF